MKKLFTLISSLLLFNISLHGQNWLWAKSYGMAQNDAAQASVTDAAGNTYVAGYTSPGGTTDPFVTKYDINGNVTWSISAVGSGTDNATAIALDASGNIYVAGYFTNSTIVFGTFTLTNSSSTKDLFIVKYNSAGSVVWAKSAGGSQEEFVYSITTDLSGNVYIAGDFESPTITFNTTTLTNTGIADMFLVKYDAGGNVLWAHNANGTHAETARSVKTDAAGNVYITGYFYSLKSIFGADTLKNTSITTPPAFDPDGIDMFLVKYSSAGTVLWAKSTGSSEHEYGKSLVLSGTDIYVGGDFSSPSVNFGAGTVTKTGGMDVFLAKFDMNGTNIWVKSGGGTVHEYVQSVNVDASGNVYLSGQFGSSSMMFGTTQLTSAGSYDSFLAKYDGSGNLQNALAIGGNGNDNAMSVTTDAAGDIYVAGYYASTAVTFSSTTLTNAGNFDMYLAKLSGSALGVNTIVKSPEIKFYPNPNDGNFYVDLSSVKSGNIDLRITDLTGRVITDQKIETQFPVQSIKVSEKAGIYFLDIKHDGISYRQKLIIQ